MTNATKIVKLPSIGSSGSIGADHTKTGKEESKSKSRREGSREGSHDGKSQKQKRKHHKKKKHHKKHDATDDEEKKAEPKAAAPLEKERRYTLPHKHHFATLDTPSQDVATADADDVSGGIHVETGAHWSPPPGALGPRKGKDGKHKKKLPPAQTLEEVYDDSVDERNAAALVAKDMPVLVAIRATMEEGFLALSTPASDRMHLERAIRHAERLEIEKDSSATILAEKMALDMHMSMWKDELRLRRLTGKIWHVHTVDLKRAMDHAIYQHQKTPLIIDNTGENLADKYLTYQNQTVVDCDEVIRLEPEAFDDYQSKIPNRAAKQEVQQEYLRKKLIQSMILGSTLHIQVRESTPPFTEYLCSDDYFPVDVFMTETLTQDVASEDNDDDDDGYTDYVEYISAGCNNETQHMRLSRGEEVRMLLESRKNKRAHKMKVVITTSLKLDDIEQQLKDCLPLDCCQLIYMYKDADQVASHGHDVNPYGD